MQRSTRLLFIIALAAAALRGQSPQGSAGVSHDGGAPLRPAFQVRLSQSPAWRGFLARHGPWKAVWNEKTRTPQRFFGPAIPIRGFAESDDAGRLVLLESFLAAERDALGIDPGRLRLKRMQKIGPTWYVSYVQTHDGAEVLFSEVELRVGAGGGLMAAGVAVYPGVEVSAAPAITPGEALARATAYFGGTGRSSFSDGAGRVRILPVEGDSGFSYRSVYRVEYRGTSASDVSDVYVDAAGGAVVRIDDAVHYAGPDGAVSGTIHPVLPADSQVTRPFRDQFVIAGADTLITDSLGGYTGAALLPDTLEARLRGRWVYVSRADSPSAKVITPAGPGDTIDITWDDANSHAAERDVFYHVTLAHGYVRGLDSSFTGLDYPLPAAVNLVSGTCNAFWNGSSINFYGGGTGCVNAAESPSTIYHEYAHAVNDRLYAQAGAGKMFNKTTHEALADVFACLIEDTPLYARGFWGPGTYSRSLENTRTYPVDLVGQDHRDGLILGGAFWDLRTATSLEVARRLSHMAKWGTPDDANYGLACAEWYVELLVADDDDADLGNGTPHSGEIAGAFGAHGIGPGLFATLSFTHTAYPSTTDTSHSYVLGFSLSGPAVPGSPADTVVVRYSTDNLRTLHTIPTIEYTEGRFLSPIPAQPAGTMVNYFIEAFDSAGTYRVEFPYGAPADDSYGFLVGPYTTALADDFEAPGNWTAGIPGDDATAGPWERGEPASTFNGWRGVQPGADHSLFGTHCYVTGAAAGALYDDFDVDGGRTTLLSPVFDLTTAENAVLGYWRWYSNNLGTDPRGDYWRVDVTGDGGATWAVVESTNVPGNFWKHVRIKAANYVARLDSVRIRFTASDTGTATLVEALVDDVEILSTNGAVLAAGDPAAGTLPIAYALDQNFPNPFNGSTVIGFSVPGDGDVKLQMFDMLGREVGTLVDGRKGPGTYAVRWDPGRLPTGIYYYRLSAGTFREIRRLVYLR